MIFLVLQILTDSPESSINAISAKFWRDGGYL